MKDRYNLLILKALKFFVDNPYKEIYLREFARRLKISPNTAQRFLDIFLKERLIIENKKANLRYFKANLENQVFRYIKKTYSLKILVDSGLISSLKKESSHVILFGSMAGGEDDKNSDIDLLIISSNKKRINEVLSFYQKKINREISSHIFSWDEWKKQKTENKAFYQDIITDGINLIGEKVVLE